MSEEQPKILYVRAGSRTDDKADLVGLISRIRREAISSNRNYFVLQLAYDQSVLNDIQSWNTLKQVMIKQGLALVVSGGSALARELANIVGIPLIGTAENQEMHMPDLEHIRSQIFGFVLPEYLGGYNFDQLSDEYHSYEIDTSLRTAGGFVEFVRQRYSKNNP